AARLVRYIVRDAGTGEATDPIADWRGRTAPAEANDEPLGDTQVAFLGHLIDETDVVMWDASIAELSQAERSLLLRKIHRVVDRFIRRQARVQSANGKSVHMRVYSVVASSALIEEALRSGETEWLMDQIMTAARAAREAGCTVVGLGGFLSIVAQNGRKVPLSDGAITTGNSYTVAMGMEALRHACRSRGVNLDAACLGGVGAGGNICSTYLRLMAEEVPKLILVGRADSLSKLSRVAETLYTDAWERIRTLPETELRGIARAM